MPLWFQSQNLWVFQFLFFLFFFLQIIITKSLRVIARLQKKKQKKQNEKKNACLSLMFFMCHNKLKWKQDCVWCQHKRMSNADVRSIFLFFFFLFFFLILCLNCCLWLRSSRGNIRKNLLFLCILTGGSHNEECGKYKLFHCTRSSIFLLLFHVQKNVLSVGLTWNRCRIKNLEERERLLFFFFFLLPAVYNNITG